MSTDGAKNDVFPSVKLGDTPKLEDVAKLIKDGKIKRVVCLAGAGISTSAGIPDFRSPETGLYANLEKYRLPYPEAIFDIDYFVRKPAAFYALARELYPGNFEPTPTHYFFKLLKDMGVLKAVFTQNIDTLERLAGLEDQYVIEAHGSFASAECLNCHKDYTKEEIKPEIEEGKVVYCKEKKCSGVKGALVKPKIVFFGEGLPARFFSRLGDISSSDLLIVLGTSLTVQPFASLIHRVPSSTPRLLINLESVGEAPRGKYPKGMSNPKVEGFDFDGRTGRKGGVRDVKWIGGCDDGVKELCKLIGKDWEEGLEKLIKGGLGDGAAKDVEVEKTLEKVADGAKAVEKEEEKNDVDDLTKEVEKVKLASEEEPAEEPAPGADESKELEKGKAGVL
ncbi:NAD-dependent deacetylase sirtuin-2 [Meredithblackwellia eburnea MCA 4105]